MEKIELALNGISEVETNELEFTVKTFEKFVTKMSPKQPSSILKFSSKELERVLGTLQDTELSRDIKDFDAMSTLLIDSLKDFEYEVDPKYKKYSTIVFEGNDKDFHEYLSKTLEAAKIKLEYLKEIYNSLNSDLFIVNKVRGLLKKDKYVEFELFDTIERLSDNCGDLEILEFVLSLVHRNLFLLEDEKSKTTVCSLEELKEKKYRKYIETYDFILDKSVSLDVIEEVIKASSGVSLTFIKNNPEIFSSHKDIYLNNLRLLRENIGDIKVVIDRDPAALLDKNLERNLKLISMYDIDLKELLCYQEKALTDLSYFSILDLMIENGYFDIKKLLDKNNIFLKKRIVLRLLGFKNVELGGLFPLNENEIDVLLNNKSTVLKNRMEIFDKCVLDTYKFDSRTYDLDGVLISRPKVLRNIKNQDTISIEEVSCNGFFTSEEIKSLTYVINDLKNTYQKIK